MTKFPPKYRPDSDISPIYRRYLPIFGDFSSKRLNVSNFASLASDTRNIADISADISDILILAPHCQVGKAKGEVVPPGLTSNYSDGSRQSSCNKVYKEGEVFRMVGQCGGGTKKGW